MPYSLVITLLKIRMSIMTFFFKFLPQAKPILFTGDSATKQLCENIAHFGHKRVLIVTDEILIKLGVIDPMKEVLASKGVEVFIYDQVEPNPTFAMVEAGLAIFRREQCDAFSVFRFACCAGGRCSGRE